MAGYLKVMLKKEQVASIECVYQETYLYAVTHCFDKSIAVATCQTFPLVWN